MNIELIFLFFIIATVYSSIGFGGGSSYLALLSLYAFEQQEMKVIALTCNIIVVIGATVLYYKNDLIKFKKVIPLVALSIPFSFLGGRILLNNWAFYLLLGIVLVLAGLLLILQSNSILDKISSKLKQSTFVNGGIGGVVGFISGLVGIGGGIFLSPILYLQKWDEPKIISATASFFILVNSVSGILGNLSNGYVFVGWKFIIALGLSVFIGGQIGTRLSIFKLRGQMIKGMTGILIVFVGCRILLKLV